MAGSTPSVAAAAHSADTEMAAVNEAALATETPRRRSSKLDWTLPSSFMQLLSRPATQVINELLPAPALPPTAAIPQSSSSGEVFVTAFRQLADALTENGGHAHQTTDSALADLSFDMSPPIQPAHVRALMKKAYDQDPVNTVKIVFHTRSIHEGKGFRTGFWVAAGWLLENHPRTLLDNLHLLVDPLCKRERNKKRDAAKVEKEDLGISELDEYGNVVSPNVKEMQQYPDRPHGTYDDLIDLLVLYINGHLASDHANPPSVDNAIYPAALSFGFKTDRKNRTIAAGAKRDRSGFVNMGVLAKKLGAESFAYKVLKAGSKKQKHVLYAGRLDKALSEDRKFQALYLKGIELFVEQLRKDLDLLDKHRDFLKLPEGQRAPFLGASSPHLFGMSYAAKWVPTPQSGPDKQLHFATALALRMFPGDGVEFGRERLQREVLTPLRAVLNVPESRMTNGSWKIDYTKLPSRALSYHASSFLAHDPQGFDAYLQKVAQGTKTISGAALFPHEILLDAVNEKSPIKSRLADLQWRAMVDGIKNSASVPLKNCLAIADVSGSMGSYMHGDKKNPQPINVCIALTLLLGELSEAPWSGMYFTFTTDPAACFIDASLSVSEKARNLACADWGMSTNFYKVFDLILATAKRAKIAPDNMVRKLFIFSDMQFNAAIQREHGETEYATIKRKFESAGYELPELVFWNLAPRADGAPKPVKGDQEGVSLVSGYSGALMKYFLGGAAAEQDEGMDDAEYDMVDSSDGTKPMVSGSVAAKTKEKKKDTPHETVMKMIGAESFNGVVVVD